MPFKFSNNFRTRKTITQGASLGSKIGATVFLSFFAGMGTFFAVLLIRELLCGKAPWYLAFFLLIPAVFMLIGFGGIYAVWFGKEKDLSKVPKAKSNKMGKGGLILFGLIFFVAGLAGSYFLLIRPLVKTWQAQSWVETPCKIISAKVGSHTSDDGTSYSVDITYEYDFSGRTYRADQYDFIGGSSSGRRSKQAIVSHYKKAASPICYVNSEDPSQAVLQRKLTLKNAIGLFPLIFVAAGVWIMSRGMKRLKHNGPAWLPQMKAGNDGLPENEYAFARETFNSTPQCVMLKPKTTPFGKLVVALLICLFWNGIISVFIHDVIQSFKFGHPEWMLTFFLIPFVLIGLVFIGAVIYFVMALFNPRYTLTLEPGRLYPGTAGVIDWKASGKANRIQNLSIKLAGREQATYRVGTNTRTAEHTFFEMELTETRDYSEIASGQIGFMIPQETMHSFEAEKNKIIWAIKIHGDIARWPDVQHEYQITVRPNLIE